MQEFRAYQFEITEFPKFGLHRIFIEAASTATNM